MPLRTIKDFSISLRFGAHWPRAFVHTLFEALPETAKVKYFYQDARVEWC